MRAALFAVAWLLYVVTAAPGAFLLDSGELQVAGAVMGVPHAPGHPLYVIIAHAASLVPFGPLGFRVTLVSGLFAAWSVVLVYDIARLSQSSDGRGARADLGAAVCALAFGVSGAVWLQAVRAEVYTLHLALALYLMKLGLDWFQAGRGSEDGRPRGPLLKAAFVVGLGAGNHHFLLLFHLPALVVLCLGDRSARATTLRALPAMAAFGLFGLLIYALLPLRAATDPLLNYGDPSTLQRFLDVIFARTFQQSVTETISVVDNLGAAAGMYVDSLGPAIVALAVLGWGLLVRERASRVVAIALAVAIGGNLTTKVLMALDPTNPDAFGYFQTGIALVASLAAVPLARALDDERWRLAGAGGVLVVVAVALSIALPGLDRVDLAGHRSPSAIDAQLTSEVAPGAVVMPSFFALHFNRYYHLGLEGRRPDVVHVHQGLEGNLGGGAGLLGQLEKKDRELAEIVRTFVETQRYPLRSLQALSERRPLYVEPSLSQPFPAGSLTYRGGLWRVGGAPDDAAATLDAQIEDQVTLQRLIGADMTAQREVRTTMTILWLQLAVARLQQGHGPAALAALDFVARISPGNPYEQRLRQYAGPLAAAEAKGDPRLEAMRRHLQRVDFTGLFAGP